MKLQKSDKKSASYPTKAIIGSVIIVTGTITSCSSTGTQKEVHQEVKTSESGVKSGVVVKTMVAEKSDISAAIEKKENLSENPVVRSVEPKKTEVKISAKNKTLDSDGDGISDSDDACPKVKGVKSIVASQNGCPVRKEYVMSTKPIRLSGMMPSMWEDEK